MNTKPPEASSEYGDVVGDPEILPEAQTDDSLGVRITPKGTHALIEHQCKELDKLRFRVTKLEREFAGLQRSESKEPWE